MSMNNLSFQTRKALMVQIGEEAGAEIGDLISRLCAEIENLRRTKVDVTELVPSATLHDDLFDERA